MESAQVTETKKRTLGFMLTADLMGKLKSKADFYDYLDKHGKCHISLSLIPFQSSSTSLKLAPLTRISSRRFSRARSSF